MKLKKNLVSRLFPLLLAALILVPCGVTLGKYTATLNSSNSTTIKDFSLSVVPSVKYYTLADRNTAFSAVLSDVESHNWEKIVFGKALAYSDTVKNLTSHNAEVNNGSNIKLYVDGNIRTGSVYVLSDGVIQFPVDSTEYLYADEMDLLPAFGSIIFENVDVSQVEKMGSLFKYQYRVSELDLSEWNTSNVTDMSKMFYGCNNLSSLDLSGFDTSNVTNMSSMFYQCRALKTLDLSGQFDLTRAASSATDIFYDCVALTTVYTNETNASQLVTWFQGKYSDVGSHVTLIQRNADGSEKVLLENGLELARVASYGLRPAAEEPVSAISQYFQSEAALPAGATQQDYHIYDLTRMPTDAELDEWKSNCSARAASGYHFYGWRVNYGSGSEIIAHENLKAFLQPLFAENARLHLTMNAIDIRD